MRIQVVTLRVVVPLNDKDQYEAITDADEIAGLLFES